MDGKDRIERGAAEEASESPLTETEARASQRPAGEGEEPSARQAAKKADKEGPDAKERREVEGR